MLLGFSMLLLTALPAFANSEIALLKKAYAAEKFSTYADDELKKIAMAAHKLVERYEDPLNCDLFEHQFMGLGQDPDAIFGLRFIKLHNGLIRVQGETATGWENLADYKMTCKDPASCLISDISTDRAESVKAVFAKQLHRLRTKKSCY